MRARCVYFCAAAALAACVGGRAIAACAEAPRPEALIGYTEFRTDLAGGRQVNIVTMRAMVVRADGGGRRAVVEELAREPNTWTQFAGWSPDGQTAVIARGWESPENGKWEEEHQAFRFTTDGWRLDVFLVDMAADSGSSGKAFNITAVDRVSSYNSGLFFWPGDPTKLGFQALIGGNSHPFSMDRDGRHKHDLTEDSHEFAYGFSASPDGRRIAYHKNYQVYVADANGANATHIETAQPFNFGPTWSADGAMLLFLAGEHYHSHPYVARADGSGPRKIADRAGYRGVIAFLDVPDFHGGSSDTPAWAADGQSIFHTAQVGPQVELFRVTLDGKSQRLTDTAPDAKDPPLHYHPEPAPDGRWLAYGSKQHGVRQLYIMRLDDKQVHCVTDLRAGHAALWPHWQPALKVN